MLVSYQTDWQSPLYSPGCEEHYSCSMIDADWNATQCLAGSIFYCRVGCILALISDFMCGHMSTYSGAGHM